MKPCDVVSAERFLPVSVPVFHMLLSLSEGEHHGHALKRAILERTGLSVGSGVLHGSIAKMLEHGFIEESEDGADRPLADERRRYYRITPLGRLVLAAETMRLRDLVCLAESRLTLSELA